MNVGDILNDIRLIIQSDPDQLNRFAQQWQKMQGAIHAAAVVFDRDINKVSQDSQGAMASQLGGYRISMADTMTALNDCCNQVANGLRLVAPQVEQIKTDLYSALVGIGLTAGGLFLPETWPLLAVALLKAISSGAGIMTIVYLVKDFNVSMTALDTALTEAENQLQTLAALNTSAPGGLVPPAPTLTPPAAAPSGK
jgi:uncharacterized protein YukE